MLGRFRSDEVIYKSAELVTLSPEGQIEKSGGTRQGEQTGQSGGTSQCR